MDNEKVKQREEFGVKATLSMYRFLKFQFAVGQNNVSTSEKVSEVEDEYGEIDFATDLAIDTSDPEAEINIKETQNLAKLSFVLDPSFSIFIARFKLGITARQRIVESSGVGQVATKITEGPTYKPHSGFGFGVRLNRQMYWMAEYEFYHYKYAPDIEPFERELSVSFGFSIWVEARIFPQLFVTSKNRRSSRTASSLRSFIVLGLDLRETFSFNCTDPLFRYLKINDPLEPLVRCHVYYLAP